MQEALREADPKLYHSLPRSVWHEHWNTYSKPVGSGKHVIEYLSRYVSRTAMGKHAIVADNGHQVVLKYKESGTGKTKFMPLKGREWIRRFLQHTLPKGFRRVRVYGWLSPAAHKRFARIQALLDWKPTEPPVVDREIVCSRCEGILEWLEHWHPGRPPPYHWSVALPIGS